MNARQRLRSRKAQAIAVTFVILLVALFLITWRSSNNRYNASFQTSNHCGNYFHGTYDPVWPDNIAELSQDSPGIVIGTVLNPEAYTNPQDLADSTPHIRITEVIKGQKKLKVGDTLNMCVGTGMLSDFTANNHNVLVYLEGMHDNSWVPNHGYVGIVPQGKDGRYKQKWGNAAETNATPDELRKLIK